MKIKQPSLLYSLSASNVWERYAYYTLSALIVLYLTTQQHFSDANAYQLFGVFSALVFLTPLIGGYVADNIIGINNSILLGVTLLCAGYTGLALLPVNTIHLSLALIITGSGFYMPNIASIIGELYEKNDSRRDGGFSIFYAGINIGAFLAPLCTPFLIHLIGWKLTFLTSAIAILFNIIIIFTIRKKHPSLGNTVSISNGLNTFLKKLALTIIITSAVFILCDYSLHYAKVANILLIVLGGGFIAYVIMRMMQLPQEQSRPLLICLFLTIVSIVFWMISEQAGLSMTIFVKYNVDRSLHHWVIPVQFFRSLNPMFIVLLAPIVSKMWIGLDRYNCNPSVSAKFAFGVIFAGLGFLLLGIASHYTHTGIISWGWIVTSYFLQTLGELFLSPIGLSMVTNLAPKNMVGLVMGVWYFATSISDALASLISQSTTIQSGSDDPRLTHLAFSHVFSHIGILAIIIGTTLLLFSHKLKLFCDNQT